MIRSKVWLFAVVVLLQIGRGQFAKAGIVTWDVSGEVTFLFDPDNVLGDAVNVGSPFFMSFSYESTTPGLPFNKSPDILIYERALTDGFGQIGGLLFDLNTGEVTNNIIVSSQALDGFGINTRLVPAGELTGLYVGVFQFLLNGPIGTFPDLALPLVPPNVELLRQAEFSLSFFGPSSSIGIGGTITEIVPEPGTIYFFAVAAICGMFAVIRARYVTSSVSESA